MYDWANSAYSTLSITILVGYLLNVVFDPKDTSHNWGTIGPVVWAWGNGIATFIAAICSPICGAWADSQANKRGWLAACALGGSTAMTVLAIVPSTWTWAIVGLFIAACFCFELSLAFYNGFLPELADDNSMNRVSAWGFGLGYIGGGTALILAILLTKFGSAIGLPTIDLQLRAGLGLLGVWWAVFSLPAILILRDRSLPSQSSGGSLETARKAIASVGNTLRHVRRLPVLACFLVGYMFYNDAVQTVISQASTFAVRDLSFTTAELAQVILMIQFLAFPGAMLMGWLSDRLGATRALHICLAIWSALLLGAYFVNTKAEFWVLGAFVALVMGGVQSVSRAIMGTLTPADRAGEFFGFFNLSGKTTSFMGTFLFGLIVILTDSARLAIVSLLLLLVIGWAIVSRVNLRLGREQAAGGK